VSYPPPGTTQSGPDCIQDDHWSPPSCERDKDSRGKDVTIYTKLRNAKGHPSDMPPGETSERISVLLPKLREHVKAALFQSTAG